MNEHDEKLRKKIWQFKQMKQDVTKNEIEIKEAEQATEAVTNAQETILNNLDNILAEFD